MTQLSIYNGEYLNALLHPDLSTNTMYSTKTTRLNGVRNVTTLSTLSKDRETHTSVASIYWIEKALEIRGVKKTWDTLKSRTRGWFGPSREWKWSGSKTYILEYQVEDKTWMVTIKATEQICGSFTNFEPRGNLTDSVAAFFTFPEFVTEDERIFLILALLVSEYKRRLKPKSEGGEL